MGGEIAVMTLAGRRGASASYSRATFLARQLRRMTPFLAIDQISVAYQGTRVLDRVSLDVARGEMIALLGSSGCGKTTLLRAIAGFVVPDSGAIRVDGRD